MIKTRKEMLEYIAADRRNAGVPEGWRATLHGVAYPNLVLTYLRCLRRVEYHGNRGTFWGYVISRILMLRMHRLSYRLGFYVPVNVFGPGVYIPHFGSVIVSPGARIGRNCVLHANVVIGQHDGKSPTIGDNVFVGPGAKVFGPVRIADNVWIGANAVVTRDVVEANAVVAGVPARIVGYKAVSWNNTPSKG